MSYRLNEITIHANNSEKTKREIEELWKDIESGKLPLLFDSEHIFQQGISPVSKFSNYSTNKTGSFNFSILGVTADFFMQIESEVKTGLYIKYDTSDESGDIRVCAKKAWEKVRAEYKDKKIKRAFTTDYESSVPPKYAKDGKAHCYLYISIL